MCKKTNKRDSGRSPLRHHYHVLHAVGRLGVSISAPDMVTIPDLKIQLAKLKLVMDQWIQYGIMIVIAIIIMAMNITETNIVMSSGFGMMVLLALLVCYVCVIVSLNKKH